MNTINSGNFSITINRETTEIQLGSDGKTSEVVVYKGITALTPVSGTPSTNQYSVSLSSTGCVAKLKSDNKTIYVESISSSSATITVSINVENIQTYTKFIKVEKVVKESELSNVKSAISVIEQKTDSILMKVSDVETNIINNYSTTKAMSSAINQKADSITQNVSATYATKTDLSTAESNIISLTTRMNTAESKLTADSLTTTIGSYYTTSTDVDGIVTSKGYATTSEVQQTASDLTATFNNGYYQGITQVNADGVKVYHTSIDDDSYTHMSPSGFYVKYKGADIVQVDNNGVKVNSWADDTNWTQIQAGYIECGGTIDRYWLGTLESSQQILLKSENGKFRARNDAQNRSVYFSDQGLSTTADGELGSSGIVDFHNDWYGYGSKGLAMYSNHHVGLIAYNGYINISPEWNNRGNNTFSFQVFDASTGSARDTDGLIYYGSHVNGYSTLIRISKDANEPGIDILDANMNKNAFLQASHLWCDDLNNNHWTSGTLTINQTYQGSQGGTQTYLSGTTVSATTFYQSGSTVSTSDIILKDNIQEYTDSALDIINKTKIYSFNRVNTPDIDEIGFIAQQAPDELVYKRGEFTAEQLEGLTIEEKTALLDKRTKELLEEAGGEEYEMPISMMNQNNIIAIMFKAIQELKAEIDELKK